MNPNLDCTGSDIACPAPAPHSCYDQKHASDTPGI